MTTQETRKYLESYKNYAQRIEYIENKVLNVHSYDFQAVKASNAPHKNQNDYIEMKEKYLDLMKDIRDDIEKIQTSNYRDVIFYKYVEFMNKYDIADLMGYSYASVSKFLMRGVTELTNILNTGE